MRKSLPPNELVCIQRVRPTFTRVIVTEGARWSIVMPKSPRGFASSLFGPFQRSRVSLLLVYGTTWAVLHLPSLRTPPNEDSLRAPLRFMHV